MGALAINPTINYQLLKEFQACFQKDLNELIELYLNDAKKKLANLHKALETKNLSLFSSSAKELRLRSLDIGAVQFSHTCLSLELAIQEMRLECISEFVFALEKQFEDIEVELLEIKSKNPSRSAALNQMMY